MTLSGYARSLAVVALTLVLPSILVACGEGNDGDPRSQDGEGQAHRVSDSAGVRVVTNAVPGPNAPAFRLSAKPRASIGAVEGAPAYELTNVRQATVLRDGNILLINSAGASDYVRIYDRAGKHIRSFGVKGDGPSEFNGMPNPRVGLVGVLPGDTLVLDDGGHKRIALFTMAGEFMRSIPVPQVGFTYDAMGLVTGGRVLVRPIPIPEPIPTPAVTRRTESFLWLSLRDGTVTPFADFPGAQFFQMRMNMMPLVFGRGLHVSVVGGQVAVANDDAYSIRVYDASGKLLQVVREDRQPTKARAGEWEEAIPPAFRRGAPNYNPRTPWVQSYENQPHLDTKPPFGGICRCVRLDQAGRLWVMEYVASDFIEGETWHVFDPTGAFIGAFAVPAKTTILDSGAEWILLNQKDDLDVEHVVLYGLEHTAAG